MNVISGDVAISSLLLLVLGLLALGHVAVALLNRPQRGLLLLAALVPFDGLLLLVPFGETLGPWKEVLLVLTLGAAVIVPNPDRTLRQSSLPVWVPAAIAFVALGLLSAALTGGMIAFWGLKVSYFYAVVPAIMWLAPFTARDRDRLVTILMATGIVAAFFGLAQQVLGPDRLAAIGYEYDTAIRFSGSLLRSFATFTQPFSFGLFLSLVLLVCLPVALADWRRTRNSIFLASTPVLMVAMVASVVRGAALALLVGFVVLIIWRFRGLVYSFTIPAVALLVVPAPFLEAFFSSSSLGQRTSGWQTIFDSLLGAPLGNGIGTTGSAAEKSNQLGVPASDLVTRSGSLEQLYLPDNQYIKTVIELGPIGLWLLLVLGAAVISAAVTAARRTSGDDRALAQGIAASVWGAAAASLVGTYLEIFPLDFYFWLLIGVLLSLGTSDIPEDNETVAGPTPAERAEVATAC